MKNKNTFEVHKYVESYYSPETLESFEEVYGLNGLDLLWSLESAEEVDDLLVPFIPDHE